MTARDVADDAIGLLRGFRPVHVRAAPLRRLLEADQPLIQIGQHLIANSGGAAAYRFEIVQVRDRLAPRADEAGFDILQRALQGFVVQALAGIALKFE